MIKELTYRIPSVFSPVLRDVANIKSRATTNPLTEQE